MLRVWKQVHAACIEKKEFRLVGTFSPGLLMRLTRESTGSNLRLEHCRPRCKSQILFRRCGSADPSLQEELNGLISIYERRGFFDEILSLLEAGLSLERAHVRQAGLLFRRIDTNFFFYRWASSLNSRFSTASTSPRGVRHCSGFAFGR